MLPLQPLPGSYPFLFLVPSPGRDQGHGTLVQQLWTEAAVIGCKGKALWAEASVKMWPESAPWASGKWPTNQAISICTQSRG